MDSIRARESFLMPTLPTNRDLAFDHWIEAVGREVDLTDSEDNALLALLLMCFLDDLAAFNVRQGQEVGM